MRRIHGDSRRPAWTTDPFVLLHAIGEHVVLGLTPDHTTLHIHNRSAVIGVLDKAGGVAPGYHDVAAFQGLEATHGTSIHLLRMVVFLDNLNSHGGGVDLDLQTSSPAAFFLVTGTGSFAVVVEHGNMILVLVESRIVLPAKVGSLAVADVFELVLVAAQHPDGMTIRTIDEDDRAEMTAGYKVVAAGSLL